MNKLGIVLLAVCVVASVQQEQPGGEAGGGSGSTDGGSAPAPPKPSGPGGESTDIFRNIFQSIAGNNSTGSDLWKPGSGNSFFKFFNDRLPLGGSGNNESATSGGLADSFFGISRRFLNNN